MIHSTSTTRDAGSRGTRGSGHDSTARRQDSPRQESFRTLEQRARDALISGYWDVERPTHGSCGDISLQRNLKLPQRPRPILVKLTTTLDDVDARSDFVESCHEEYGSKCALLYVECETTTIGGSQHLYFEEMALVTAVGTIVSFHGRPNDHNTFRLRMAHDGNSFGELESTSPPGNQVRIHTQAPASPADAPSHPPAERNRIIEGTLTAWKSQVDEPHKEYGWIEGSDGHKYNAYWRAFANEEELDIVRDLADEYREPGASWSELDVAVRFEIGPPQRRGQNPRAVEITLEQD